jgi:acetoin utilization deacetylase AcuC-like enzyme
MQNIQEKIETKFKTIEADITVERAFELLSEPEIDTLIYLSENKKHFYYITEREISSGIQKNQTNGKLVASDIAIRSFIFDYDQYIRNNIEYLSLFKKKLSTLGLNKLNKFLVISKQSPIGLVSDLVFEDLPGEKTTTFRSKLDIFIETEADPKANINLFYDSLAALGFNLTPKVKEYIAKVLHERIIELQNNKAEVPAKPPELTLNPDQNTTKDKPQSSTTGTDNGSGIAIIYHPKHISHRSKAVSPEMPERLIKIMDLLKKREKVFCSNCRLISEFDPATEEDLLRVHTKTYVNFIKNYAAKGGGFLGDSTYITKSTHELALLAVGGAIKAAEEVLDGRADFGLALIRPPGHHASSGKYGGYCIYNNAAVLARYLKEKKGFSRILILDWDAHAANGTQEIFYDDPSVMLISLHQDPHNFYPKTGFMSQMGKGNGLGYTINLEMPRGSGDEEYIRALNELVMPLIDKFNPDFVIGCNGFDPHHSDTYTNLHLTSKGYYEFSRKFNEHMKGKMVILMEGGYNPFMGELTLTMINGLLGQPNQFDDKHQTLFQKVIGEEKIDIVFKNKLNELKLYLNRYKIL